MSATPIALPAPSEEIVSVLDKIDLFANLPDAVFETLSENSEQRDYAAGQTIFSMGQYDGGEFLIVESGKMRVTIVEADTGAMFIDEFSENDIFGLEIAMSSSSAEAVQQLSVTAEEDCSVVAIDATTFRSLAGQRPTLMRNVAMHFAAELSILRYRSMAAQAAPEQRVYAALLEFVKRDNVTGVWRIESMPKHRELADMANVEESDTANAIATLIQEGVAVRDYPGMLINDMTRLGQLSR
ncbi:MAG: Crp/Fnr family transcriptional regulator [Marinicaulis sp.]|nr:Crp/Fnr family transcriptional regulator [Marinicaulis sp.]